ncbi:MAG TPA: YidB family protein [Rhizobiaceae bacterium]|nr:YidB family protein [Rhizobiaceae bacterium]
MGLDLSKAALAMLGVVALRAFVNHEQQARTAPADAGGAASGSSGGLGGLLGSLGGMLGGAATGGTVAGGLGEVLDGLKQAGHGDKADSWVSAGANEPIRPNDLENAIGSDTLAKLAQQTGLSKDELLQRLSQNLPSAIDQMTPHGRVPTADEADNIWGRQS